jgi:tripartite-type tricarboxylate transporter receptor subunit TctC
LPLLILTLLLPLTAVAARPAAAENYPSGPIRIIVGFGPSSTADIVARLVGKFMEARLGQPVVVENRPGNSSMTAAEAVGRAPNDGRTLFMATVANTLNPARADGGFDLLKSMQPIALLGVVPNLLVTNASVNVKTVGQLIALAKAKPNELTFGTSGQWTASHLAAEMFNVQAGTKIVSVPYQGGANQAISDLLTGRINLMFNVAVSLVPQVNAGKLTALAVGQPKRTDIMPDVPTMEEAGMPGFDVGIWIGLLAPASTSSDIVEILSKSANDALKQDSVKTALKVQGIDAIGSSPEQFSDFIGKDIRKWKDVLAATGLK